MTNTNKRRNTGKRKSSNKRKSKRKSGEISNITKICLALTTFIVVVFFVLLITMIVTLSYDKVYDGLYLNEVSVSHMSKEELSEYINEKYSKPINDITIHIVAEDLKWELNAKDLDIKFNKDKIIDAIYDYGHNGNMFKRLSDINSMKSDKKYINIFSQTDDDFKDLVSYKESVIDSLANEISTSNIAVVEHKINITETSVSIVAGKPGYSFDKDKIKDAVLAAVNEFKSSTIDITQAAGIPVAPKEIDVDSCCSQINKDPVDAGYVKAKNDKNEINHMEITKADGQYGFSVDRSKLVELSSKLEADPGKTFAVEVTKISPTGGVDKLPNPTYDDVLGEAFTKFSASDKNKKENIRLGSAFLNGYIVLPGEQFSFNGFIGNTTEKKGYKEGWGYESGKLKKTFGGGICQVSTTLYNAVINSVNLQVDKRNNHSSKVEYVPYGLDCMVNWNTSDFLFTNNTNYPVKIVSIFDNSGNKITFKIMGVNEYKHVKYEFKSVFVESSLKNFQEVPTSNPDETQSGKTGGTYTITRITYENGVEVKRETKWTSSTYRPMNRIYYVAPVTSAPAGTPSGSTLSGSSSAVPPISTPSAQTPAGG